MSHPAKSDSLIAESILAVIPTLNEEAYIETCIRSLMTGDPELRQLPLTIADGGSTDRTVEIVESLKAEFPNIRLLHNPNKLQAAALNLAVAEHANEVTSIIVRCDAHSIYPENFILNVAQSLQTNKSDSLVIPMDAVGNTCFEKANAWIVDTPLGSGGSAHRGGRKSGWVDHGHHAGFSRESWQRIGGYDEAFSHNEDAEYDQRLAQAGGRIYMDANIRIKYVPRASVSRLAKQYYAYGKGRAKNIAKHGQKLKVRQALPIIALLANLFGLVASLVFWPALIIPAGYVLVLAAASLGMAIQKRSICGLLAGLASGTMHMSWAAGFILQKLFGRHP